ncbi:hypothetical protein ACMU_17955 [Actibacterium mucosum KCTC 23349]|uniref:Bifunctional NAD(P)H-hydrate repair enzyme n=1 Tax=Actibacterium mucosum KCTC 23349 TaxID=1454373 RepID=A0A037ZGD0_9RHOB|nr:bifunctional ADP-dependent NAD(P)H-hydrate dehydratase/NAD(P)H-hydrate epimerase [Actibacterium mucosum]KAJ54591.1 hypothetical protein ACMU_17955 [Actibacterium mucosum KCTC 23349]
MTELLTSAQMRAIERAAIDSGKVTGLELMERAGAGVVEAVFEEWPELQKAPHRAVVLCGPGNNGGDGFVVARLLKEWGWQVRVYLYGDPEKLPPDARVNFDRWKVLGKVGTWDNFEKLKTWRCDLVIDALFGTGLKRGLEPLSEFFWDMEDIVDYCPVEPGHKTGRPAIVSVDIPSGICSDSGKYFPHEKNYNRFAATAHLTVSFHRAKLGHYLSEGPKNSGKTVVKSIGLEGGPAVQPDEIVRLVEPPFLGLPKLGDHKYSHGHVLILSGDVGKTGAARLAARGALRAGAGLVTVGAPATVMPECAAQLTAIMLRQVGTAAELNAVLGDTRINALCIGPGLGLSDESSQRLAEGLKSGRAVVLDADALTLIGRDAALFAMLHDRCILTPHGGEFARLFPDIAERLSAPAVRGPAYSKINAVRAAAARAGCVVLFKGPDTVIAAPDGRCSINAAVYDRAAPWLATAGSGDVLAGFLTGLLARGFSPMEAAETGAWLHVECARKFGPGVIAEDLPEMLPAVFRDLGL